MDGYLIATDLIIANATMFVGSVAIGYAASHAKRRLPRWLRLILAFVAVASLVAYSLWLQDNLILARLLPVADVIAWTNLQFPAAMLLAGLVWAELAMPRWQRIACCIVLSLLGFWRMAEPYLGAAPRMAAENWRRGVCHQSTTSSCSPAAAATALAAVGIHATEAEMADLCLTRVDGTLVLGLYRGLKLKTAGSKLQVSIFTGGADKLSRIPVPAVVVIHAGGMTDDRLSVGDRHSVVIFGFDRDGSLDVGDPWAGRQRWPISQFAAVYDGCGMSLTRR